MNDPVKIFRARFALPLALVAVCMAGPADVPERTLPAGTSIVIRTIDAIDSKKSDLDRDYAASLADPIVVDGVEVVPQGANAFLRIEHAQGAKPLWGRASLKLKLVAIAVNGQRINLASGDVTSQSGSQGAKTAKHAGVGAAAGAGIGAVAAGGLGAAIGAGIGAAAGATVAAMSGERVKVAAETRLTFTLASPAVLPDMPGAATGLSSRTSSFASPAAAPPRLDRTRNQPDVMKDGIRVQLQGCYRKTTEATTCEVTVEALSEDMTLSLNTRSPSQPSFLVDSQGMQQNATSVTLGSSMNQPVAQTLVVQNIAVRGELQFPGSDANVERIALLNVVLVTGSQEHKFGFRDIPLQSR